MGAGALTLLASVPVQDAQTTSNAEKLRDTIARVVNKSAEEVMSIKSLLTTGAKSTKAMNDLTIEMTTLSSRMEKFNAGMESCRSELRDLEQGEEQTLTPQQVNDPLLCPPALLQLHQHAQTLRLQVRRLTGAVWDKELLAELQAEDDGQEGEEEFGDEQDFGGEEETEEDDE